MKRLQGLAKTVNGLELSFSATAKGYGIDKVAQLLESHDITNYMVEIGGELRIAGEKPNNQDWKIAIEQPDAQPGERKLFCVYIKFVLWHERFGVACISRK